VELPDETEASSRAVRDPRCEQIVANLLGKPP